MGQGGTLPIKKEQTISLYNTTGVIERDKNIYYSPFIKASASKIKEVWLTKFKTLCSSPTDYTNISISSWSPEDRTLKVRGNVDDFRLVTEHGLALNYLILTRKVYDSENTYKTYYYAFFITNVSQAGQGSVTLTLDNDNFTNVFYLHNEDVFSGEGYYDAFNGKMKNCYVARQHYNRVKVISTTVQIQKTDYVDIVDQDDCVDDWEEYEQSCYWVDFAIPKSFFPSDMDWNEPYNIGLNRLYAKNQSWVADFYIDEIVDEGDYLLITIDTGSGAQVDDSIIWDSQDFEEARFEIEYTATSTEYEAQEDNLPIFSQIEESFKFKRLVRDYKRPLNYGRMFTDEELEEIKTTSTFNALSVNSKLKFLKSSIAFLHLVTADNNIFYADYLTSQAGLFPVLDEIHRKVKKLPNTDIENNVVSCVLPFCVVPNELKKYESSIKSLLNEFEVYMNVSGTYYPLIDNNTGNGVVINTEDTLRMINNTILKPYFLYAYISREHALIEQIDFKVTPSIKPYLKLEESQIKILPYFGESDYSDEVAYLEHVEISMRGQVGYMFYAVIDKTTVPTEPTIKVHKISASPFGDQIENHSVVVMPSLDNEKVIFNLNLTPSNLSISEVTEGYYDTVLTFVPYSYYTLSYLGRIENILNKLNYYENPVIEMELTVLATDFLKYSVTPTYTLGGLKQKYYSEGFEQTFANNVTISTDHFIDYIINNSAQMRNQFAVNDYRYTNQMIETAVNVVPNAVKSGIRGYMSGGKSGAVAGVVTSAIESGQEFISNVISKDTADTVTSFNQQAKLSDMGVTPQSFKQVGTDISIDLSLNELGLFLNHYKIDEVSYNSICKYLERFGYMVNIYDTLNVTSRVGWDFVQLASFDYNATINTVQEESIRQIFLNGVTLLHNHDVMISGHNYETILEEVINNE